MPLLRKAFEILLVEDNPADVEITVEAFRRIQKNHRLHVCRDGEEALDFLFQRGRFNRNLAPRPDLVLLDLNLPRRSGTEVLEQIKKHEQLRDIPVIMLSTSDRDEDVKRCYHLGANSYLSKPIQFDECVNLVAAIQTYWLETSKLPPQ
jgi:CheY-like chemotaxis protein